MVKRVAHFSSVALPLFEQADGTRRSVQALPDVEWLSCQSGWSNDAPDPGISQTRNTSVS